MASYLQHKPDFSKKLIQDISPEKANWTYIGFHVLKLAAGETYELTTDAAREYCFTLMLGKCDFSVAEETYAAIGERNSPFEECAPYAVYVPPAKPVVIKALTELEIAISTAPAEGKYPPRLIRPEQMARFARGQGSNTRYICDILPETEDAESLLVVEVVTPAGNSSSYPPHKHDTRTETETILEESYYHRLSRPQGFGFQRVYDTPRELDEAMGVEDHDVVLVPRGYHPCAAVHGYDLYYLNTMAGPERCWLFCNDPSHEWVLELQQKT